MQFITVLLEIMAQQTQFAKVFSQNPLNAHHEQIAGHLANPTEEVPQWKKMKGKKAGGYVAG
jgi:hypothetical protein